MFKLLGLASTGIIGSLVVSVVGAVVLLWIVSKVKSKA
ncbi:MAG: GlsB/YeaQ/YmgE family stress response membrane protein [Cobetia sp.]